MRVISLFEVALFVDLVALSNGLHGSIFMDWVAPQPWNIHFNNLKQFISINHTYVTSKKFVLNQNIWDRYLK